MKEQYTRLIDPQTSEEILTDRPLEPIHNHFTITTNPWTGRAVRTGITCTDESCELSFNEIRKQKLLDRLSGK